MLWGTDASMVQTSRTGGCGSSPPSITSTPRSSAITSRPTASRFSALEPISQALTERFGGIAANAARGVTRARRQRAAIHRPPLHPPDSPLGHGAQPRLPAPAGDNGVCERFFRTLKEQAIFGRIFRTAAEVKAAVSEFVARYNASWHLARLGYPQPARLPGATLCGSEIADGSMSDPAVRSECDRSRRPDLATPGQRAQGRSSKAAGLRVSGSCLTGPSTVASFPQVGSPQPRPATL